MVLTATGMALWLAAALAARRVAPHRAVVLRGALIVAGIPLLGAATLAHGPLPGLAGLAIGTALLLVPAGRRRSAG
ncbi:DUF2484 family protein [Gemmobacter sp.]|uniref:DUF2484 family protein n=1 Tax=Gemmobacter sp. TaxID=1898957 RepID=UPI002AFE01D6|nr:DUF2484 family protein [Gemmobacter sp.]